MHRIGRGIGLAFLKIFDMSTMFLCFASGEYIVYREQHFRLISSDAFLGMRIKVINLIMFIAFIIIWHAVFSLYKLYPSKHISHTSTDMLSLTKAVTVAIIIIYTIGLSFGIGILTPSFIIFFWISSLILTACSRMVLRFVLRQLRLRGRNLTHLLIAGTNLRAINCAQKIESDARLGYMIGGFVDDKRYGNNDFRQSKYSIVADFVNFPEFIRTHIVDEVMICLPFKSHYNEISDIVEICEEQGIPVRFPTDFFDLKLAKCTPEILGEDATTIAISSGNMRNGWPLLLKRTIDIFLALIALLLFSPIMLLTAVLIKSTSSGPVFFTQHRLGINKRLFKLYKFRTMIIDAETRQKELEDRNEASGAVFKIEHDPRVTKIGKYLRKMSIDELPQLINVLKGDMSLVGPRPLPIRDFHNFNKDWHRRRFTVRPGITCLWQVKGRSNITFDQWMELDLRYIDHWSLNLDLIILAKTIPAVLKGSGAM